MAKASTGTEVLDQRLAAAAIEKARRGEKPSKEEARALRRFETAKEERDREKYYRTIPKRHFLAMAGRQATVINQMGLTWDMPVLGRTVDIYQVIRWLYDFLATNKYALRDIRSGKASSDPGKRADVAYKRERTRATRLRRLQRQGQLLDRREVHEGLSAIAGIYRRAGARLRQEFGEDAYQIVEECWDDATRKIDRMFGERAEGEEA